jgi:hypothetical protein
MAVANPRTGKRERAPKRRRWDRIFTASPKVLES